MSVHVMSSVMCKTIGVGQIVRFLNATAVSLQRVSRFSQSRSSAQYCLGVCEPWFPATHLHLGGRLDGAGIL